MFLISEGKFLSHQWRQLLELELVLFFLTIWISDCFCLAHIVEIRIHSLSVLIQDRISSSYFSRKLFKFWAYTNSLDHLDCSLAVFYKKNYCRKQIPLPIVVGTCSCAIYLEHLNFRLFIFSSHSWNKDTFTVSFNSRQKFIFLFLEEAVKILSFYQFSWSFGLQSSSIL